MIQNPPRNVVIYGDCSDKLKEIPDGCIHVCVTSPPYYKLRDYGHELQIGQESTPEQYIEKLVGVFREVRRVLHPSGTLWLNLKDTFVDGEPLCIPWGVAFALKRDGWSLKSDIIWAKVNPLPENVTSRPAVSHEIVFMFAKSKRHFYDSTAVYQGTYSTQKLLPGQERVNGGHHLRTVWYLTTSPYQGKHIAVMPKQMAELCIMAGTSGEKACSNCGAPLRRVIEKVGEVPVTARRLNITSTQKGAPDKSTLGAGTGGDVPARSTETVGWARDCTCETTDTEPCLVLDPFAGSGTTLEVAKSLRRDFIGIELNESYKPLIDDRVTPAMSKEADRRVFDAVIDSDSDLTNFEELVKSESLS